MAGKSSSWENGLQLLVFNNTNFANVGDATGLRGSTAAGSLYCSLHTADPGEAGTQSTNEITYTGYARVAVARSGAGFTVTTSSVSPAANVDFGQATAGTFPITCLFFGIGTDASGAGTLLYSGALGTAPVPFTSLVNDDIVIPNRTFVVDNRIQFFGLEGLALPTGMAEGTVYWVKTVIGDVYTVSATQGGVVLNLTTTGSGFAQLVSPITINLNSIPRITTATTITEG